MAIAFVLTGWWITLILPLTCNGYSFVWTPGFRYLQRKTAPVRKGNTERSGSPCTVQRNHAPWTGSPGSQPRKKSPTLFQSDMVMSSPTTVDDVDPESLRSSSSRCVQSSWNQRILKLMGFNARGSSAESLTFRQRLTKTGVYAVMSYNVVSQVNSGSSTSIAWFFYSMRTGLSPLAPGQWKGFLTFYAGFWVVNNFLRPFRLALALTMAPKMEQLSLIVQNRTELTKTKAVTLTFLVTYLIAVAYSATCMTLASICSGVPIFPS